MRALLALPLIGYAIAAAADGAAQTPDAEALFAATRDYTVEVHGNIHAAFDEDSAGAGTGTGFLVDGERGWILTNAHVAGH